MNTELMPQQPVPTDEASATLSLIIRTASDPTVDIAKMEALLSMHRDMRREQAEAAFNQALARVQAEMIRIAPDKRNEQTRSDYATYAQLDRVLRPLYSAEGFALSFGTDASPLSEHVRVICDVTHTEGHSKRYFVDMPVDGKGAKGADVMTKTHAMGSGMQYGRRYLLKGIFNVAEGNDPEDDDGNGASQLDDIAIEWIDVAEKIKSAGQYEIRRAELLTAYKGDPSRIPPPVLAAFNGARERVFGE